ncbi:MAG: dihydroorotate dehydrogenase [Oscillibacter sp.]|nr:dihydroorotate dehydrogenase [Oscillibacter sp.]
MNLSVTLAGVALKNPVIPASGTFGYGREYAALYDLNLLGAFSWKGTTAQPRDGNPSPRIAETPAGMLNAIGLQNPGIDAVIREEVPNIARIFQGPVIANVGGFTVDEYAENCRKLDAVEQCKILEINISCPNVHAGGRNFGTDAKAAAEVTAAVRRATRKPVFMKLTPNVSDITEIARACADAGADGLCLINTLLGMRIDLKTRRPVLANRTGGLSGPAIFPVALRMVWDVYEAVRLPIIGCGGVASADDVAEMMLAGASAVEIGAANLRDPYLCKRIVEELPGVCKRLGVENIAGLTGAAHE